jgi:hypothetical protein
VHDVDIAAGPDEVWTETPPDGYYDNSTLYVLSFSSGS